jgi:hypothetical protein
MNVSHDIDINNCDSTNFVTRDAIHKSKTLSKMVSLFVMVKKSLSNSFFVNFYESSSVDPSVHESVCISKGDKPTEDA